MGKDDDYQKQEARRQADKRKADEANERVRQNMANKAEYERKEREKTHAAFKKLGDQQAKNAQGKAKDGGCFIATAAFGGYNAPEVIYLSAFRDETLSKSVLGRGFIHAYYTVSPRFAAVIAKSSFLRLAVRKAFLRPILFLLRQLRH